MTFQLAGKGPEIYETVLVPLWFGRWATELFGALDLRPGQTVLDVACGTGVTTRLAKHKVGVQGRVDGLDINAGMLATAAEIAGDADIRWIESDVTETALPSDHYDVILSQHGYHYFPDKPGALAEFLRLLKPGGRLAFSIWAGHSPYTAALCAAVEAHISPEIAAKQNAQRVTPTAQALAETLTVSGYSDVQVVRQELQIDAPAPEEFVPLHLASMPIAQAFAELSEDRKSALISDVATALKSHIEHARLVYPDAVHVAIGTKP